MRGAVLYRPGDVRFEERAAPAIIKPTDAIIRISATCVCGPDLWPYRGLQETTEPTPMGHEYCGIVEEVGSAVTSVKTESSSVARKRRCCVSRSRTAPWWPRRKLRRTS
jgi:threonine dehydrogenase-like Zn-dependent dehydrogenase